MPRRADRDVPAAPYGHDPTPRVVEMAYADGVSRSYTYDALNRLIEHTVDGADPTTYACDRWALSFGSSGK